MLIQTPRPMVGPNGITQVNSREVFAANAGASVIANIAVPSGCMVVASLRARASAGVANRVAVTAVNASETFTAPAGHGFTTGMVAFCVGTAQPTGVSATTAYFLNVATNTIKLYDTAANAVTGGGTGLVSFTTDGTSVVLIGAPLSAAYFLRVAAKNQNGVTALVGSADLVAFEDVSAWALTATANNTTDVLEIKGTPDGNVATAFEIVGEVQTLSLVV
jgi:hypothetical protein